MSQLLYLQGSGYLHRLTPVFSHSRPPNVCLCCRCHWVNEQFGLSYLSPFRGVRGHLVSEMANPLRGEVIKLYKTVSELVASARSWSCAANGLLMCFSSSKSSCILAVSTPREQPISGSAWSQLSWRIKTWQTLKRSNSWWPAATLSSRNWRLSISSGSIEPWRRGIMSQKNNHTHHRQHQRAPLKWCDVQSVCQ